MFQTLLTGVVVIYLVIGAVIWLSAPRISVTDELLMRSKGLNCEMPLSMNLFFWPYTARYYYLGGLAQCMKGR
jgi:hypothetical protein